MKAPKRDSESGETVIGSVRVDKFKPADINSSGDFTVFITQEQAARLNELMKKALHEWGHLRAEGEEVLVNLGWDRHNKRVVVSLVPDVGQSRADLDTERVM